jgi:diacylglycerol kinase
MSEKSNDEETKLAEKPGYRTRSFPESVSCAVKGIYIAFKKERNFRIHVISLFLVVALGLYLDLSVLEWSIVIISAGFVLASELFNTALERLGDHAADGKSNILVKNAKDISAAAVFISALIALTIGIIILFIPFVNRLLELI